ncbi:MAG: hypothetical protein K6U80_06000 [Firmicutes bacterium]|nr:hypothetical protein [Bacillota bacterium]
MNAASFRTGVFLIFIMIAIIILTGCEGENNQNLISGTETILNGGFESGDESPRNWFPFCKQLETGLRFAWDGQTAKTGAKSIQLTAVKPNYTGWVQIVLLKADTNYRLSGWIKTKNVRPSTAFNPKMTHNAGASLAVVDDTPRASKEISKWRIHSSGLLGSNPWTYIELTFNSGPHTRVKIIAQLGIWGGPTTGTAWFDDLKLQKI